MKNLIEVSFSKILNKELKVHQWPSGSDQSVDTAFDYQFQEWMFVVVVWHPLKGIDPRQISGTNDPRIQSIPNKTQVINFIPFVNQLLQ